MNKGVAGGGTSGASGPTVAAATAAAQKQKSLQQRVDNDIGSIVDNFSIVVNVARVCPLYVHAHGLCVSYVTSCKSCP